MCSLVVMKKLMSQTMKNVIPVLIRVYGSIKFPERISERVGLSAEAIFSFPTATVCPKTGEA